jgi:hypothetical protein
VAPYAPDEAGVLRVVLPQRCAHAKASQTCSLFINHLRDRQTGPGYPLAVVGCSRHPVGRYTLYPPGHIPYGRQAVVRCRPSGSLQRDRSTGQPVWEDTLLGAAVDVASGQRWPAHSPADDDRRRRTQGGRLELTGKLLGVHPDVDARSRERIATRLLVPTLRLRDAAGGWAASWQPRGAAILCVLQTLPVDGSLLDRLLAAGAVAGLWPEPQRWDPGRGTWVRPRSGGTKHDDIHALEARGFYRLKDSLLCSTRWRRAWARCDDRRTGTDAPVRHDGGPARW